ncbi:MAG: LacI family DNA-binding transcriptional regulator [Lachnospiraceae bacterium]
MGKRITIQDIADSLGVSRNTVSKALNNTGILAESTKRKVLSKAAELGYKQFIYSPQPPDTNDTEIRELALFTQNMPGTSHFGSKMLNSFQGKISLKNYKLSIFLIRDQEIISCHLPNGFDPQKCDGIICVELFDLSYTEILSNLNIPLLFVDAAARIDFSQYNADFLLMENHSSIYNLTNALIKNGYKKLAFAGNVDNCQSFYERYAGFSEAIKDNQLIPLTDLFEPKEAFSNLQTLTTRIFSLPKLPDAFICANDFVAIDLLKALRKCSFEVPKDVMITGFDDAAEAIIIEPHLTTVHIPSSEMGIIAADLLMTRIQNPKLPYRTTYVRTHIKYRESSRLHESTEE